MPVVPGWDLGGIGRLRFAPGVYKGYPDTPGQLFGQRLSYQIHQNPIQNAHKLSHLWPLRLLCSPPTPRDILDPEAFLNLV